MMAAFEPVAQHYSNMDSSQINQQRNYEFTPVQQHAEPTKNPNVFNQIYSSNHLNINHFNHYNNQYPYSSSSANYLSNSAPQTTAAISCLSQALGSEQFGLSNNMDSSSYGNPLHNHICPPAIEDVTMPTSVSNLLAQNSCMESSDNQLQRVSPSHYYSPLQQQVANQAAVYQHQHGQPLGDYYHFGAGSQQCENYQSQGPLQQQFAAISSASANGHSFTTPFQAASFNLDYASLQHQMFEGSSYEQQPGSQTNQNGSLSTPNIAIEVASRLSPDRCYAATSLSSRQGILEGDHRANGESAALESAVKDADNPSQLFPATSSLNNTENSLEDSKRRLKQQLASIAQTNKNKVGTKVQHPSSSASASSGSLGMISRRKNATRETTSTLKDWLDEHGQNPYPTKGEKIMLSIITKMSLTQVSTWFANARRRMKKESKVFWNGSNSSNMNRIGSSTAAAPMGTSNGANSSFLNKNGASSIRYFIHKHRKQLAGAGSMLALSGESRYAPIVYCGQSSALAPAAKTAAEERQQHSGNDNDTNKVNGDNKRDASKPIAAAPRNSSSLSHSSSSNSQPAVLSDLGSSSHISATTIEGKANKS